ncbi:8446_t:CDS:2 [Cetraspora pellucida]|uniref:8446_t:CDS:1 n=1 Tax=Cetraspora pellucida TaxID=1433469 RepID=A0ACA9LA91_9GLOM|nr:8446_t:CDS:2 [Cetraspora pellucida]
MAKFPGLETFQGDIYSYKLDGNEYLHKSYQYAKSSYRDITDMNPKFVLYPKTKDGNEDDFDDIYKALEYAQKYNLKIAIRTGGHQYSGASSTDRKNLQLDLSNTYKKFEWIDIDKTKLEVGISYSLKEFVDKLTAEGRFLPSGQCEYVGLGGHVQTGGYGQLARGFGLLTDYVDEIRIISYDTTEQTYTSKWIKKGDELFRAVIGGSPGNFGVITHVRLTVLKDSDYSESYGLFAICAYDPNLLKEFLDIMLETETVNVDDFDYCITFSSDSGSDQGLDHGEEDDPSYDETYNREGYFRSDGKLIWPDMIIIHAYQYKGYNEATSPIKKIRDIIEKVKPAKRKIIIDIDKHYNVSLLVENWITLIRREFQLQYIKRGYVSDWEPKKLKDTNWSDWIVKRINLAICNKLKVSAQFKYFGGENSEFYKKGLENKDSLSWRDMNFGVSFDTFFEKDLLHLASEWQRENDKCISVTNPTFCDKDMRLLWASYDLNLDYFHDCYYDTEKKYADLCYLREKYDPKKIFIPNKFCVGVKNEVPEKVLKDILDKNSDKFDDLLKDVGCTPIWKRFERRNK